jgi:hypothetical protein
MGSGMIWRSHAWGASRRERVVAHGMEFRRRTGTTCPCIDASHGGQCSPNVRLSRLTLLEVLIRSKQAGFGLMISPRWWRSDSTCSAECELHIGSLKTICCAVGGVARSKHRSRHKVLSKYVLSLLKAGKPTEELQTDDDIQTLLSRDKKMSLLERGTNPNLSRRTCTWATLV